MKIIKNYFYNVGYQVFVLIIPLITVPYTSRVLGSTGVGINAFTNSIIQYFVLIASVGINLYGNRTIAYYRDDPYKKSKAFFEIVILRLICVVISYAIFIIFLFFVDNYKPFFFYQSFLILAVAFDVSWYFMGMEDFRKTVTRNMIIKIISLISIFTFVKNFDDLGNYILILSLSTLFGNLTLWTYLRKRLIRVEIRDFNIFQHIFPTLSLFVPQIATQVYLVLNKTMLGIFIGVESAGFYENSDKIIKIVLAIVTATGTVMLPRMANTFAKGEHEKVKLYLLNSLEFVTFLSAPMAFGLAAIAPKFSVWFLGDDFSITGEIIPILSLVIIFIGWSNVFGTQYLLPTNQNRLYTLSIISGALVNLVLNSFLIHFFNIYGAAVATVFSEIAVTSVQFYFVRNTFSTKELISGKWKYFLSAIVMFFIVNILNNNMNGNLVSFVVQVLIGMCIYLFCTILLKVNFYSLVKKYL